jgi:hypothetical protein
VVLLVLLAMAAVSVLMLLIARHAPITSVDDRLSLVDRELEISRDARLVATH